MASKLKSIMDAADRLTVDAIAQEPYCVPRPESVEDVCRYAKKESFDLLPVRETNGAIRRTVKTALLEGLSTWPEVLERAESLTVDDLIAREAPVLSILGRIQDRPLFCLGSKGVGGIVTVYDLNQPAAHYFGLALAIVIESEVGRAITDELEQQYPGDRDAAERVAGKADVNIDKWNWAKRKGEHVPLISWLSFGAKLRVLNVIGMARLMERCLGRYERATSADVLGGDLDEILKLRNDVAHEKAGLADSKVMCQRLARAHDLAHALAP